MIWIRKISFIENGNLVFNRYFTCSSKWSQRKYHWVWLLVATSQQNWFGVRFYEIMGQQHHLHMFRLDSNGFHRVQCIHTIFCWKRKTANHQINRMEKKNTPFLAREKKKRVKRLLFARWIMVKFGLSVTFFFLLCILSRFFGIRFGYLHSMILNSAIGDQAKC